MALTFQPYNEMQVYTGLSTAKAQPGDFVFLDSSKRAVPASAMVWVNSTITPAMFADRFLGICHAYDDATDTVQVIARGSATYPLNAATACKSGDVVEVSNASNLLTPQVLKVTTNPFAAVATVVRSNTATQGSVVIEWDARAVRERNATTLDASVFQATAADADSIIAVAVQPGYTGRLIAVTAASGAVAGSGESIAATVKTVTGASTVASIGTATVNSTLAAGKTAQVALSNLAGSLLACAASGGDRVVFRVDIDYTAGTATPLAFSSFGLIYQILPTPTIN